MATAVRPASRFAPPAGEKPPEPPRVRELPRIRELPRTERPREVFREAIAERAAAVILVHNHPSGDPTPSPDDRAVTDQLVAAGKLLDILVNGSLQRPRVVGSPVLWALPVRQDRSLSPP